MTLVAMATEDLTVGPGKPVQNAMDMAGKGYGQMKAELIGHYGGDETHALSAWTSTKRELTEDRASRIGKMLKMLAENAHHTPFEKSTLHFLVEADTASHIHVLKHRIGVSVNGESARYKKIEPRHHIPDDWPLYWRNLLDLHIQSSERLYSTAVDELTPTLGRKRAKESARYFLTYSNVLTLDVTFNFRSFMHFMGLRGEEDEAQREIFNISQEMLDAVRDTGDFDLSLDAFGYGL
jgi:flavin-dependent thymidylate synthase